MLLSVLILNVGSTLHVLWWFRTVRQAYGSLLGDDDGSNRSFFFRDLFVFIRIWIDFLHQPTDCNCTDRVGRQHTELPFFSFMAGWEKEGGQWFLRALVGSQLYSFHCTSMLPFHIPDVDKYFWIWSSNHFTFLLFSSGQNSRIVPRGRRQLHGVQEDRGQQQMWRFELKMICSVNWYFHFGDLAQ